MGNLARRPAFQLLPAPHAALTEADVAGRRSVDDRLAGLQAACDAADAGELPGAIGKGLSDSSYRVVALAARLAADGLVA